MKLVGLMLVLVSWAALMAHAAPPDPGFYTFDGSVLRPLVQKRAGNDMGGWKQLLQPFSRSSSFLAALTERGGHQEDDEDSAEDEEDEEVAFAREIEDDEEEEEENDQVQHRGIDSSHLPTVSSAHLPAVSSAHLLPDYLTHQEFLKPQLQAAGFSGGRIIAGPFPVPLTNLPKPPPRSGSVAPPPPPPPPPPAPSKQQHQKQPSPFKLPGQIFKQQPQAQQQKQYKPVQFPAVPIAPPPPPPQTSKPAPPRPAPAKINYVIPSGGPVHWHAAHQSGPEKPAASLGQPTYSHPAVQEFSSSSVPTRLSYGGWTPIYSASYSHVAVPDDVEVVAPQQQQQQQQPVTERSVAASRPEAVQELDEQESAELAAAESALTRGDDSESASSGTSTFIPLPADEVTPSSTSVKKTVRKRKAKQVPRWNPSSPIDTEVAIVTAVDSAAAAVAAATDSLPVSSSSGRVQGRYVGRVLPASLYDDDVIPLTAAAGPLGWRQITRDPLY